MFSLSDQVHPVSDSDPIDPNVIEIFEINIFSLILILSNSLIFYDLMRQLIMNSPESRFLISRRIVSSILLIYYFKKSCSNHVNFLLKILLVGLLHSISNPHRIIPSYQMSNSVPELLP